MYALRKFGISWHTLQHAATRWGWAKFLNMLKKFSELERIDEYAGHKLLKRYEYVVYVMHKLEIR